MFIALCLLTIFHATMVFADTWDGSAAAWTHGSGTESDPYLIESAANLAYLAEMVNGGISTYSGQYFKLTTDVNLNSRQWTGIGINENVSFQGIFDGDNHSVTGINATTALFAYAKNSIIKNLKTNGEANKAGIVYYSYGILVVDSCINRVTVTCNNNDGKIAVGGIICTVFGEAEITNCSNFKNVTAIYSSTNSGSYIGGYSSYVTASGGIVGSVQGTVNVSRCCNWGIIHTSTFRHVTNDQFYTHKTECYAYAGGIVGQSTGSCNITQCYNSAACSTDVACYTYKSYVSQGMPDTAIAYAFSGGIMGYNSSPNNTIRNSYNRGNIYSLSLAESKRYTISNGYETVSTSQISNASSSGISRRGSIVNCYNTGTILDGNNKYGIGGINVTNSYYLSTCGGSGNGIPKTANALKSSSMPSLLNASDNAYIMDFTPNINDGYPIFGYNVCCVVTESSRNITFHGGTINGRYTEGDYWPGGTSDLQGFEYKNDTSSVWNTVYTNIDSPFEYNLIDLTPNTTYNYRAFVTKDGNTYYGEIKSFTTLSCSTLTAEIETQSLTICTGDTATLTASGNSAYSENFSYHWNTEASIAVIKPTESGTYTVTVTDDNGCSATASVLLTVNPRPEGTISGNTTICPNGNVTLTASGANSYTWSTGATTPTLTTSTAGTYTCTFRNSYGCTSTQDVTISVFAAPVISGTTTICSGNSTTLTASCADSYTWSTGATTPSITVSEAGTYTVMGYTDGCNGSAVVTVVVESLPTITISGTNSFCQGGNTTLTATGGSSYVWANGSDENNITVNSPGIYTVTGIGVNGCSNTASIEVTMRPSYINMPVSAAICQGTSYNAMGTTYSTAGTYHVEGTTAAGCDSIIDLTLTVNPQPTPSITGNTSICQGASTTLAALGGTSFLWNNGSSSQAISVSNAGVYSVTVTDANGCSNSTSATVSVNPLPTVTIAGNTTICAGNSTTLTASGADSYQWSTGATGASITITNGGTYTVTGTSANGCQNTAAATVTVNPTYNGVPVTQAICEGSSYNFFGTMLNEAGTYTQNGTTTAGCDSVVILTLTVNQLPTATISGNTTFCEGGSTTLTATGGASYLWNDGTTTSSISVANGGAYSVTVTDANGCSNMASTTVTVNPLPNIVINGNSSFCQGGSTTLTAQGGNSYTWSNGAQTAYITVTSSGNYTVTGVGANGCSNSASVSVTASPLPTITIGGNTSFCQGGNTTLTASGADSYAWSNGTTTPSITVDAFGVYSVTGTTALGCTGTASVTVTVSPNPTITITGDTELCPGESTTLTANGGTSYMWFDGSSDATYQTGTAGSYTVIGYNDAGCYTMVTVDVQQYDNAQTEETATATGTYLWNGESYSESGDYTYTTTTEHGCDSTVTLHLTIEQGGGEHGIDDVEAADGVRIYTRGNRIVVEASNQQAVSRESIIVYDVMGRVIKSSDVSSEWSEVEIPVTSAGIYMVKVGERQSHKVVVR